MNKYWWQKTSFVSGVLLMVLFWTAALPAVAQPNDGELERIFSEIMQEYAVVGSSLVVVENGRVVGAFEHGWGHRDGGVSIDADRSLFPVGSVSTLFTHASILHLAVNGLIDLDAPVAQYLSGFDLRQPFQTPLTIRHLLTHQDGYETRDLNTIALSEGSLRPLRDLLGEELPPAVRRPGSSITYGVYASAILGLLVETVSGQSLQDYAAAHIFEPLGMDTASFIAPAAETRSLVRTYYWQDADLRMAPRLFSPLPPSQGMYAAPVDMAAFLAALTQVDDGLIGPPAPLVTGDTVGQEAPTEEETVETPVEEGATAEDAESDADESTVEAPAAEAATPSEPEPAGRSWTFAYNPEAVWLQELLPIQIRMNELLPGIGYGFMESFRHGQSVLRRPGQGMGGYSEVVLLPNSNRALFYVQNTRSDEAFQQLLAELMEHWYPEQNSLLPSYAGTINTEVFTGTYRPVQSAQHTLVKMETLVVGELLVEASGPNEIRITPLSISDTYGGFGRSSRWRAVGPLTFQEVGGEALLAFEENARGEITALHSTGGFHGSYEPISRWQSGPIQLGIILGSLLVLALNIVIVPIKLFLRRGWRPTQPVPVGVRLLPWWSLLVSLFFVGGAGVSFYALFWREIAGMPAFAAGVSQMAQTGLAFLISGVGLLGVQFLLLLLIWRNEQFHAFSRFWQTIVILAGATASLWLWHWNLLGAWF